MGTAGSTGIEELAVRAQGGDADAFSSVYELLAPRVLRYLRHEVGDVDVAEELMQRTFLKVVEALPAYERRKGVPFAAWVFTIARNAAIDERRRVHPGPIDATADVPSPRAGPDELALASLRRRDLLAALERLPADQHDVLVYRFFGELSPREVARIMYRTEGSVRVLQHRALRGLRTLLTAAVGAHGMAEAER